IKDFEKSLPKLKNKKVASILKKAYQDVTFEESPRKNSFFVSEDKKKNIKNTIFLAKSATPSTIAHELFHKVDYDNEISRNRLLVDCINSDYENLKKIAENAGLSIEDMLYLRYPKAFEKKGRMKTEYRGFSDIIHGMTLRKVDLGYGHRKVGYWEEPLRLQKETFAQYGRFYYENNPKVIKLVNEMLPETSKQMEIIINMIIKFGG
ncbi:MAG: hypothetical protein K2K06_08040, partial [Oscillospiraceae bacterium]|nr:hypothetical protein [Oscillospiraceae bacterium]